MSKLIKISKIENQINEINIELNVAKSIANILIEAPCCNIKQKDTENLAIVLQEKISNIKKDFSEIISILEI